MDDDTPVLDNPMHLDPDAARGMDAVDDTYERLHEGFASQPGSVVDDTEKAVKFAFDLAVDDDTE